MAFFFLTFSSCGNREGNKKMTMEEMMSQNREKKQEEMKKQAKKEWEYMEKFRKEAFPENTYTPNKNARKTKDSNALTLVSEGYNKDGWYIVKLKNTTNKTITGYLTIKVIFTDGTSDVQSTYIDRMEQNDIREIIVFRAGKKIKSWKIVQ